MGFLSKRQTVPDTNQLFTWNLLQKKDLAFGELCRADDLTREYRAGEILEATWSELVQSFVYREFIKSAIFSKVL